MTFTLQAPVAVATVAEWQSRLDVLTPVVEGQSRLWLRWEPGEPHAPVGRWMIWELFPRAVIPEFILEDLQGPNPRTKGYFDQVLGKFVPSESSISKAQWDVFRETGRYGELFWVVQGHGGGHKRYFGPLEKKLCEIMHTPDEPPPPGSLAYAPFDNRVIDAITEGNDLRLEWSRAMTLTLPESKAAALRAINARIVKHVFGWIEDAVADIQIDSDDLPRTDTELPFDLDEATEHFINS